MNPLRSSATRSALLLLFALGAVTASEGSAAAGGYKPLPVSGCPADGQFNLNQFSELPESNQRIFRGGKPRASGMQCLSQLGVTLVIDLRSEGETSQGEEESWAKEQGITYAAFPMTTDTTLPSLSCETQSLDASACNEQSALSAVKRIHEALEANPAAKVYVHCSRGEDRTGLALGLYRFKEQGWSADAAYREMREYYYSPYAPLQSVWSRLTH